MCYNYLACSLEHAPSHYIFNMHIGKTETQFSSRSNPTTEFSLWITYPSSNNPDSTACIQPQLAHAQEHECHNYQACTLKHLSQLYRAYEGVLQSLSLHYSACMSFSWLPFPDHTSYLYLANTLKQACQNHWACTQEYASCNVWDFALEYTHHRYWAPCEACIISVMNQL